MSYKVVAPLVLAKDAEGRVHERYEGATIAWLSDEQARHFLGLGLVEEIGAPAAAASRDDGDHSGGAGDGHEEPPKQVANKAAWEDWAVNHAPEGQRISAEEAETLTKKELIARFG